MAKKTLILDPSQYDLNHVIADIEEIRRHNRQRYEMEQLTAICYDDPKRHICAGYKDLGPDEFWIRGHMPGIPIMPGVVMCEVAAQMASYYTRKHKLMNAAVVGFGGLKDVRFRGVVRPGDRFVIVVQLLRVRSSMLTCRFECFVRENLVCEGILKGVALSEDVIKSQS
ncbi:MAG: beta-hydroxyacyl-ACP dehydratase [Planctomycetes bacterium RBG_16_64_12]|nr:MAG: beta-hydroxyacyl-ACP dehydratase [Planctomycetes bacterium RBG_16_64_12]